MNCSDVTPGRGSCVGARSPGVARLLLVGMLVPALGCTQTSHIATVPSGAKVWVNEEFLGVSPVELTVESGAGVRFPSRLQARIERAGYEPLEVVLPTQVSGGRVAAGIFTLGMAFYLQGVRTVRRGYVYALYPIIASESDISDEWVRGLRQLDRLRQDGLLSDQEYERRRSILLRDIPHGTGELNTH